MGATHALLGPNNPKEEATLINMAAQNTITLLALSVFDGSGARVESPMGAIAVGCRVGRV